MSWKEASVVEQRLEFVLRAIGDKMPFSQLCREYGVAPKTGYKWKERFIQRGLEGLHDLSRKPRSSPQQVSEDVACRLFLLKLKHVHWGPAKILELYRRRAALDGSEAQLPSLSTVKRVLDKAGLVQHRKRRPSRTGGRIVNRVEASAPNDVWTVDFKGWWYSSNKERVEPLTVRDAFSRYVLCAKALDDGRTGTVRRVFESLFETHGLPGAIRSDNGTPFASTSAPLGLTRLSAWWVALGIALDRIAPGRPCQNGAHERMHKDLALEVEGVVDGDLKTHRAALETWRHEYNHERPHEALEMRTPAELYTRSEKTWEPGELELTYPEGYLRRLVGRTGSLKVHGQRISISTALGGWHVGLKPLEANKFSVWFGPLCLGQIDLDTESFQVTKADATPPEGLARYPLAKPSGGETS